MAIGRPEQKPCPACGSSNVNIESVFAQQQGAVARYRGVCMDCGKTGPEFSQRGQSVMRQVREAIRNWNAVKPEDKE